MARKTRHTASYLTTSRHGMYCMRVPIPRTSAADGRKYLQLSLGTRDPDKAERLASSLQLDTEAFMEQIKQAVRDKDGTPIPHNELKARIEAHYRAALETAKAKRSLIGPSEEYQDQMRQSASLMSLPNRDYWRTVGKDAARAALQALCDALDIPVPSEPGPAMELLDHVREASKAAAEAALEHSQSLRVYDLRQTPAAAPASPAAAPMAASENNISVSLKEAVAAFLRHGIEAEGWAVSTANKREAMLDVLLEWYGPDHLASDITKREAAKFKTDVLLRLPANRMTAPQTRSLSLRDSLRVSSVPKISNPTVNQYLGCYRLFWAFMVSHGMTDEVQFSGLQIKEGRETGRSTRKTPKRSDVPTETLQQIVAAMSDPANAYYQQMQNPRSRTKNPDSLRWATLIGVFSGMRLNEIAQLDVQDVTTKDGVPVFVCTDDGGDKRLKSGAATRSVPIHSKLLELGLMEYVQRRREAGKLKLFEFTWTEKAGYGAKLSKWFNRTLANDLNLKQQGVLFHSLRHSFITRLGQAGVQTEVIQFIIGHERQGTTHQVYLHGYSIEQCKEAVERFAL